eukprot:scaffold3241_cov319-Prasinococcus_capsulatus_cf.AAC.2
MYAGAPPVGRSIRRPAVVSATVLDISISSINVASGGGSRPPPPCIPRARRSPRGSARAGAAPRGEDR